MKIGDAVVVAARVVFLERGHVGLALLDNNDYPRVSDLLFTEKGVYKAPRSIKVRRLSKREIEAAQHAFREK